MENLIFCAVAVAPRGPDFCKFNISQIYIKINKFNIMQENKQHIQQIKI